MLPAKSKTPPSASNKTVAKPDAFPAGSRAPAVNRAIRILHVVADSPVPLGVNAVARAVDVPSSCLHILRALEEEGLLACDPESKRYSLGLGLVTLARTALNWPAHAPLLPKELDRLARISGATAIAAQLAPRDRMVIVAVSHGPGTFGVHFDIGRRFPSYVSATGRCVAAHSGLGRAALYRKFDALIWDEPPRFNDWLA